jgi:hypothetical protein
MTRARQLAPLGRVAFAILLAIAARPFVWLFDRIADVLYRATDVTSVADCVARVCRMAEDSQRERRSWASLIRRSGYRRFHDEITFEMLRDEFRRRPEACASWQAYSDDIRHTPAWVVGERLSDGRYMAGYRHHDPEKRREYYYQTLEEACARFLMGFLEEL